MNIPAISMATATIDTQSQVGVAMLSKSLDVLETQGDGMVKLMEQSVAPNLGSNIDVSI